MISTHIILIVLLSLSLAVKLEPLIELNTTNFKEKIKCDLDTFMEKGSPDKNIWFILFKIPGCKYCEQAQILFFNTYVEYNKKFHLESKIAEKTLENNVLFAQVNCQQNGAICDRFNIPQYPYFNIMDQNGKVCIYQGGIMPNQVLEYLQARKQGNKYEKCKYIGKITFMTKVVGFLEPIIDLLNYNTIMFVIAFVLGPFLFGFVFTRVRRNKQEAIDRMKKE